eukprot:XP_001695154.1 predicted protein [Chlamydomonas reinhardtii]
MEERPARLVLQQFWWSQKHPRQVAAGGDVNSSSGTNPLPLRHTPLPLTLFTMASLDRLPLLQAQCRSYPGPLSAAVYLPLLVQAGAGAGTEADAGAQHPQGSDPAAAGRPTGAAAGAAAAAAAAGGAVRPELAAAIQQLQVVRPRLLRRTKFQAYVTHSKNMDFWQRRGLVLGGWRPTLSAATQRCWQQLPWWRRHKHEGRH